MEKWENERESLNFEKIRNPGVGKPLEALLNKIYKPSSRIDMEFKGKDISFFTDENGVPMSLFLGKRKSNGDIAGNKFARRIKKIEDGKIKESHWDNQGKIL